METRKTLSINGNKNIKLTSTWTATTFPSVASDSVVFNFSIQDGYKVDSAYVTFKQNTGSPKTGISLLTVNGLAIKDRSNGTKSSNVTIPVGSNSLTVTFKFKANGSASADSSEIEFTELKLVIMLVQKAKAYTYVPEDTGSNYVAFVPQPAGSNVSNYLPSAGSGKFPIPPQSVVFFKEKTNKDGKATGQIDDKLYYFDGVTKISANISIKIDDEEDKKKYEYTNHARNESDKVTLDVIMSDVYTGHSHLSKGIKLSKTEKKIYKAINKKLKTDISKNTRSGKAFATLKMLKENRDKMVVVTPQAIYTDMLIQSVVMNQDSTTPFGWEGQVVFEHTIEQKKQAKSNNKPSGGKDATPTESLSFKWLS